MTARSAILLAMLVVACTSADERRRAAIQRAEANLEAGLRQQAIDGLEVVLGYDPRDVQVIDRLAAIHLDDGQPFVASQLLQAAPSAQVEALETGARDRHLLLLARADIELGRLRQATAVLVGLDARQQAPAEVVERLLLRAAERDDYLPHELPASWHRQLVGQRIQHRRLEAARRDWRLLDQNDSQRASLLDRLLRRAAQMDDVALLRSTPEASTEPPTPWKLLARHRVLVADGATGQAATIERRFLRRFPEHPERATILLSLARRETRSGRPAEGLEHARLATTLQPEHAAPLIEMALALDALGRSAEATRALDQALSIEPSNPALRQLLERRRSEPSVATGRLELSIRTDGAG